MSSNFIQFYLFKATPTETEIPNEQLSFGINKSKDIYLTRSAIKSSNHTNDAKIFWVENLFKSDLNMNHSKTCEIG